MPFTQLGNYAVLGKTSNTCQKYDNSPTVLAVDFDKLKQLEKQYRSNRWCTGELYACWGAYSSWYECNASQPFCRSISKQMQETIENPSIVIPNPSYDPYWLAVNRRIIFLGGDGMPDLKWEHSDRNLMGFNEEGEIEAISQMGNFITSVAYYKYCSPSDPICNTKFGQQKGWYADVTYSCSNTGDSTPDEGGTTGSGGQGSNQKCPGGCGDCELSLGDDTKSCCCLDLKLMKYIVTNVFELEKSDSKSDTKKVIVDREYINAIMEGARNFSSKIS